MPEHGDLYNPHKAFREIIVVPAQLLNSGLSSTSLLLFGLLARHAGNDGRCFPSVALLADELGIGHRRIKGLIAELVAHGLITSTRGAGARNRYTFTWDRMFDEEWPGQRIAPSTGHAVTNVTSRPVTLASRPVTFRNGAENCPSNGQEIAREGATDCPSNGQEIAPSVLKESLSESVKENRKENTENTDSDDMLQHRENRDAGAYLRLCALVAAHLGRPASRSSIEHIISATRFKTPGEAIEAIEAALRQTPKPPRTLSWFVTVTQNHRTERARRALPPQASDSGLDPAKFADMAGYLDPDTDAAPTPAPAPIDSMAGVRARMDAKRQRAAEVESNRATFFRPDTDAA